MKAQFSAPHASLSMLAVLLMTHLPETAPQTSPPADPPVLSLPEPAPDWEPAADVALTRQAA